ncbi:argininosuccinate lyase [Bacteroidota bacterium]
MKIWQKSDKELNKEIELFTVGNDREYDLYLSGYDILGSLAHIKMLESIGLLNQDELDKLTKELQDIMAAIEEGNFEIEADVEDVHSQVELMLTRKLGDTGKKIHSGRSRNDQVLLDLKLFMRDEIGCIVESTHTLVDQLLDSSEKYKDILMPGYTHFQVAMPSSFGLWFGAYAESLVDDILVLRSAFNIINRNPLGSAAGYGSSFPLNRQMTTDLLGFESMNYNVIYAQMGRGKVEKILASAMSNFADTLSKLAMDAVLFMNQNFGFISLPDELTTGSSIMPHKKNPDVFEIIRGKCNALKSLPNEIELITSNLPSGYHREMQLIKEKMIPALEDLVDCLDITTLMFRNISVNENILEEEKYKYLFSVEEVNKLVLQGVPFRDAYMQVGEMIEKGKFDPEKKVEHTHEGTIGNLMTNQIATRMEEQMSYFHKQFEKIDKTLRNLIAEK